MSLVACPFCKEVYAATDGKDCPICGIRLGPLSVATEAADQASAVLAPISTFDLRYGRGLMLMASVTGVVAFLMPWVRETFPYQIDISGFDIAQKSLAGWMWGPLVAWMVLQSMVVSRRSRLDMMRARLACVLLALVPVAAVYMVWAHPPEDKAVGMRISWGWGMWAELAAAVFAIGVSLRLGKASKSK